MRQTDEASHQVADELFMRGRANTKSAREGGEANQTCPSDAEYQLLWLKNDHAGDTGKQLIHFPVPPSNAFFNVG